MNHVYPRPTTLLLTSHSKQTRVEGSTPAESDNPAAYKHYKAESGKEVETQGCTMTTWHKVNTSTK